MHKTTKIAANDSVFDYIVLQNPVLVKREVHNETKFKAKETLNVFFLTTEKLLSPYHVCSIESAARAKPNLTFYLIILSSHDKKKPNSDKRFDQLSGIYKNIKLYHLMGEKYFYDSPIRDIFENNKFEQSIITFAARILTLWRYGGITFDMSLITTNNISSETYPIPKDNSVMLSDSEGTVMSVRMQCQALLFEFLKTLAAFHKSEKYVITKEDIIETALNSFCYNITMKKESPRLPICKGVSVMPNDLICNKISETALLNTKCIWSSVNGSSLYIRQQLCPVAYHSHTSEEYKHANLTTHKRKVKFVT
ncbi:hypothetical protein C0J52_21089 [Blattella germanica]|nr:hypothetical protein C0J52_21089 [Blattella germanica]